jgi:sec-independent protein translocase protein TatA
MFSNFALLDFGTPELILILAIVLLLFGGKKLPELSRSIGESMKELRKGISSTNELKDEVKSQVAKTKESLTAEHHEEA